MVLSTVHKAKGREWKIFLEDLVRRDDIPEDVRTQASALLENLG